jgi:hypothetical protein
MRLMVAVAGSTEPVDQRVGRQQPGVPGRSIGFSQGVVIGS